MPAKSHDVTGAQQVFMGPQRKVGPHRAHRADEAGHCLCRLVAKRCGDQPAIAGWRKEHEPPVVRWAQVALSGRDQVALRLCALGRNNVGNR